MDTEELVLVLCLSFYSLDFRTATRNFPYAAEQAAAKKRDTEMVRDDQSTINKMQFRND